MPPNPPLFRPWPLLLAAFAAAMALFLPGMSLGQSGVMQIAGDWRFALGSAESATNPVPPTAYSDTIQLPGTTDTNSKGPENTEKWTGGLTRLHKFVGPAWYERDVVIPETWRERSITLFLERTKHTRVWVDGQPRGESPILCTPQEHSLGVLDPGPHRLTLLIDNSRRPVESEMHQMSENTQGNWNGVIGRIELKSTGTAWLEDLQVYPNIQNRTVRVVVQIGASGKAGTGTLELVARVQKRSESRRITVSWDADGGQAETEIQLHKSTPMWDEFHPAVGLLTAKLAARQTLDERSAPFGLREFGTQGTQFTINGRRTFLRGKHDGCVFPITGHPPMNIEGWLRYFQTLQDLGINHVRFHSWTPPEAAFAAADQLGIYLQPELPFWGAYDEAKKAALLPEAEGILKWYGNHPSFVMFALGNECGGSHEVMGSMVTALRQRDSRHLYAQGSNNYLSDPKLAVTDDYWTTFRTGVGGGFNVRGSFATVDGGNGHVQLGPPGTTYDYTAAIAGVPVPVIGHEVGQYTVYPDFREIPKYTGVFRARNLEYFRERLTSSGMLDQAGDFFRASAKLAGLCYREEVETALRTPGFGGFQLLDLQDFPGQGTALVGLLNAFTEPKEGFSVAEWRQSCGPVVLLARLDRMVWSAGDRFLAHVQIAHYGEKDIRAAEVEWNLKDREDRLVASGKLGQYDIQQGGVKDLGAVSLNLPAVPGPEVFRLNLGLKGRAISNSYSIWVFPAEIESEVPAGVKLFRAYNEAAREALAAGARVVLIPEGNRLARTVGGGFATDFWCWPMFHNAPGTMGLLCNPEHAALREFPTAFHSDWQWFHILTNSVPVILDDAPTGYRPLVQVIDNLERVHKLGLIFEAKSGPGSLLVCATDLLQIRDKPEARQLLRSLLDYAGSDGFAPQSELSIPLLKSLLSTTFSIRSVTASSDESATYSAARAVDKDVETKWSAADPTSKQWIEVDLGRLRTVTGCSIRWESDQPGYSYLIEGSKGGARWTVLSDQTKNKLDHRHLVEFGSARVRFVRVAVIPQPKGPKASIRELEILGEE